MSELERVKKEQYESLLSRGYHEGPAKKVCDSIIRISGYFNGKPSRVQTADGLELWLF